MLNKKSLRLTIHCSIGMKQMLNGSICRGFVSRDNPWFQIDFMHFFYRKFNKFCFATVDKMLKYLLPQLQTYNICFLKIDQ